MDFSVLGPVEVRVDGTALPIGSGRERFVLAVLLLNAGKLTPAGQLIDAMWTDPPSSARAQLHNIISNLRRRLGPGAPHLIASRPSGYELSLGTHKLDVLEFRHLTRAAARAAAEGNQSLAIALLGEALAWWRGPALADLPDELAAGMRQVLDEERLAAAESRLDLAIELGRFDVVLGDATALIAEYPYREKLWCARMLALAGTGRQAEALETYRRAHRRFTQELGVEPGPELRRLERRILRGDFSHSVHANPALPGQLPPVNATVVGRDKLIGEMRAELAAPGGKQLLLVGPGGVGKTTLALTVAHEMRPCFPDGQLYADLRGSHDDPVDPHAVAGRFLRALGVDGSTVPDDPEERIALYRSRLAPAKALVVLDDAASEHQVRPLLPGGPGCAAIVTSRRRLTALVTPARWPVPVLEPNEATELLRRIAGGGRVSAEPEAAAAISELCGQLPLAVCVAAARLSVHPEWTLAGFRAQLAEERHRLDELAVGDLDVRASIALSYRSLHPELRGLLRRLGLVAAPGWPAWVAAELIQNARIGPCLEQLLDVHLVEPLGLDGSGQRRFRLHDLVADFARERALEEETDDSRAAATERMLSGWLALATEADGLAGHGMIPAAGLPAPELPSGAPLDIVKQAPLEWLEAERVSLTTAVDQACRLGFATLAGTLALRLSGFLSLRAYHEDRRRTLRNAMATVRAAGQDELLIRLLGALFAASLGASGGGAELAAIAAEELALARRLGDRRAEVGALANAGWAARKRGRLAEAVRWLEQALGACDGDTPSRLRTRAMHGLALAYRESGRYPMALPLVEEALALERPQARPRITAMCLINYASALADLGRLDEAERALAEALETAQDLASTDIAHSLADIDRRRKRWDSAVSRLHQALAFAEDHGDPSGAADALCALGDVALGRGMPGEAIEPLRRALALCRKLDLPLASARVLARLDLALSATAHPVDGHLDAQDRAAALTEAAAYRRECEAILAELGLDENCLRLS